MEFSILEQFAETNRLKVSKDECGDLIVQGRSGHVYEYSNSLLGVMFMPAEYRPRLWSTYRRSALALGMRLFQDGDAEGSLTFDPGNAEQTEMALRIARVKKRRTLSPERVEELRAHLANVRNCRSDPCVEGHFSG